MRRAAHETPYFFEPSASHCLHDAPTISPCHTTFLNFPLPLHHRRHATPRHATPCHAMPCHVTSSSPLQPIDCWSTRPWNRHRVNVRMQLVRSTSLAYSLTISRTRHRHRRRSTGILTSPITHHGRPPSTDLAHYPLTLSLAVTTYFNRAHALCTPTTHATAILIHHDHCLLCRSPKTPPCPSPCHFSSPPQAITTSPLPVPPPLPPPPPPSPPATNCTNATYSYTTYATYATTVTTLRPAAAAAAIDHFHHRRQIHQHAASAR